MDQESKDANSLLVELDRGLKSINIGEQSESVVRFSNLFQRYPLPIIINSACMKLAEAFRVSSNFIRVQICEVFGRNQIHLNKIYNVDEFYRNIFTVTTSNDPIARSVSLITLGNIAPIVAEYKTIHHYISSSLESTIDIELSATINCAASYVKQSSEFACNIYPKILSIIDSYKTSTEIKMKALAVLDHGFYNAHDAFIVRSFLINVISKSQLQRIICTCLTLSTKIAHTSLTHIVPQIELLLKTFFDDKRHQVKLSSIRNLKFLAEKSPHIWQSENVEPFVSYIESSLNKNDEVDYIYDQYLCIILSIFRKLLTCKCNFISQSEKTRIFQISYKLALNHSNAALCSMAFELLVVMCEENNNNMIEEQSKELTSNSLSAIRTFLTNSMLSHTKSKKDLKNLQAPTGRPNSIVNKSIYRHIVQLCHLNPHYCPELLKLVFTKISSKDIIIEDISPYITEFMCAIVSICDDPSITPESCWKLLKAKSSEMTETNLLNLCVLYFQIASQVASHNVAQGIVDKVTDNHSVWFGFKVMRQAMRYGHFNIAGLICGELHDQVTNDTIDFYFESLAKICAAESLLSSSGPKSDSNLKSALPIYEESVSPLRASIGNARTTDFQIRFILLRVRTLRAHSSLRLYCKTYEASPITYSTLLTSNRGNDQSCSIFQQIPKISREFRSIADCYENLASVSFNSDNSTLDYLYLLKASCTIMSDLIDSIFYYGNNLSVISKLSNPINNRSRALEQRKLERTCNKLIESIRTEVILAGINPSDGTIEPLINLLKTFSDELLSCPFVYPRYFFQPLQMFQIKLAITPQPTTPSGPISLLINTNLVLKVEGLIVNHSKREHIIREVSKVHITVTVSSTRSSESNCNLLVQSTATPQNNYFKTEFLLPLRWAGSFNVDIEVSIIDEHELTWRSGPTEKLNLIVSAS